MRILIVLVAAVLVVGLAGCRTPLTFQDFRYVGEDDSSEDAYLKADVICRGRAYKLPPPFIKSHYFGCMAEQGWLRVPDK
jgi:hypothetical protein